jgi:NADPH:quinone reductase-like Zn-dependent oxidoreductase
MRAARIHEFGPPNVITIDEVEKPGPGKGEVLVEVAAAGVGPWDAWIREKKSVVSVPLPLILGSDFCGTVRALGPEVAGIQAGARIYGVTNPSFCGAYAEYAIACAGMIALAPSKLNAEQAASAPVVAVTAWQMLFDYAEAKAGQTVLILGGAGNVGAYAAQLASQAGLAVIATASGKDADFVRSLGATRVLDKQQRFDEELRGVHIVLDTVGGETRDRSVEVLAPGGILVSIVSPSLEHLSGRGVRAVFFLVQVSTERLNRLSDLFDRGKLTTHVGPVLPLAKAREAHEMLAGPPHKRGKIVLRVP